MKKLLLLLTFIACLSGTTQLSAHTGSIPETFQRIITVSTWALTANILGEVAGEFSRRNSNSSAMIFNRRLSFIIGTASVVGYGYVTTKTDHFGLSLVLAGITGLCAGIYRSSSPKQYSLL